MIKTDFKMRTTIIVRSENTIEAYTGFKKMCKAKGFPYHTLCRLKFPIYYKDYIIYKCELL